MVTARNRSHAYARAERRDARRIAAAMYREFGPSVCNWPTPRLYLVGRRAPLRYRLPGYLVALWAVIVHG